MLHRPTALLVNSQALVVLRHLVPMQMLTPALRTRCRHQQPAAHLLEPTLPWPLQTQSLVPCLRAPRSARLLACDLTVLCLSNRAVLIWKMPQHTAFVLLFGVE